MEIRCAPDEDCSSTVNEAQLTIGKTGSFKWVPFRDFRKFDVCSWRLSPDSSNTLDFEDCPVDPDGGSDTFVYHLSGNNLILTGAGNDPTPHELIRMRFQKGPLISDMRESKKTGPETCNTAPMPRWAKSATQIASDWDLHWPGSEMPDPQRAMADRNRRLWDAVRAFQGSGRPITLKAVSYSIEGDIYEEYLFASGGHVEVVEHTDNGWFTDGRTCTRRVSNVKLKMQDSSKLWRFATRAPYSAAPAYIVYPWDDDSSHVFPKP